LSNDCYSDRSTTVTLYPTSQQKDILEKIKWSNAENPIPQGTLGDIGLTTQIIGPDEFNQTIVLKIPYEPKNVLGIDPHSIRIFRWDDLSKFLHPVWNSGINTSQRFVWAKINRPGLYTVIGLPRDPFLRKILWGMARDRRYSDLESAAVMNSITKKYLQILLDDSSQQEVENVIQEIETQFIPDFPSEVTKRGTHGSEMPFIANIELPLHELPPVFKQRVENLKTPQGGLPEESLFYMPEDIRINELNTGQRFLPKSSWFPDWWMYHHDELHSGQASSSSNITSTSISRMQLVYSIPLDGPVISIPCIVNSKVFVGTGNSKEAAKENSEGGTLYRIDLVSGNIERTFNFRTDPGHGSSQGFSGIGSSPAIVAGKIYFSGLDGRIYCLDANTFDPIWITDLRNPDPAHNQPVQNIDVDRYERLNRIPDGASAEGWSSPLVVNNKVYVGFGEGESGAYGFVYCLNANSGHVIWLFCTNKVSKDKNVNNRPNVIPLSAIGKLLAGFEMSEDPAFKGVSVWSSCTYDSELNQIFVATGNSTTDTESEGNDQISDTEEKYDNAYGCGVLALGADSGEFKGFFQQSSLDNYRSTDDDVDIGASPLLFKINNDDDQEGKEVGATKYNKRLAIGGKNGSFFLLNPKQMELEKKRQLLPKDAKNNNTIGEIDNPFKDSMMPMYENMYGIFGTTAVHYGSKRLFVGIGGYDNSIDTCSTPFMRALDWETLEDVWITSTDRIKTYDVARYMLPSPPMYHTEGEAGLSSPAVVNDVVFMSTSKPGFYAFEVETGLCVWEAPEFISQSAGREALKGITMLGPAIYRDYVVIGYARGAADGILFVYSLG
jgi:outer membrane protein assembly factor BamB